MVVRPMRDGFVFEDVGFCYPGANSWALRHITFAIAPGERIALVGENGAGKTTLTKLFARLYDPTEGRVLLEGRDLREYDLASLRDTLGITFQDFVRFDMRFEENVGVGKITGLRQYLDSNSLDWPARDFVPDQIVQATERALAGDIVQRLPDRYRQMLGRRFDRGIDLSGGEWQRVALARAYIRDAELLILDEPTAALDARAEFEVFTQFNALMSGRMVVLISHRFSTIRMADRILVLERGRIVDSGTHEELAERAGLYGELFAMQSAGYR
jgi:ATP-binding cassette subfamily B protein